MNPLPDPRADRLPFLDALRILAFALLVLFHVGMYYVSWDWHVKSPWAAQLGAALEPWMQMMSPWRMSLLFVISGAATAGLWARRPERTLRARLARLLAPLVFGVLLIVPPQSFLEVVQRHGYTGSYADFLRLYFSGYGGFCKASGECLILPTWNHLWFLPYLAVYTALAWLVQRVVAARLDAAALRWSALAQGPWLFALPILALAATRWLLRDRYPPSHALLGDWYLHAQYLPLFLAGLLWARGGTAWAAIARVRGWSLLLALLAWALLVGGGFGAGALRGALGSTLQWCGVLAALGFAAQHLSERRLWVERLSPAVFPVYLVHQTVTIVAATALLPLALNPAIEAPLLLVLTFGASGLFYVAVRRVSWLRLWCGLPPRSCGDDQKAAATASIDAIKPA